MAENRGKQFEGIVRQAFERVPHTTITRLPDPTSGFLGVRNICDFIVYHHPHQYFIECKSVHDNILPLHNITHNQWSGLLEMSQTYGVVAGVLCWWIDRDVTRFFEIETLEKLAHEDVKSIRYDADDVPHFDIYGKKKRVFFDYNMNLFFKEVANEKGNRRTHK